MNNISPITQIFNYPQGLHLSTSSAQKVFNQNQDLNSKISKIHTEINKLTQKGLEGCSISFVPQITLSADSKSVSLGSFEITKDSQTIKLDLSYEEYENGIKSISISSSEDIDSFNYSIKTANTNRDKTYRSLVEKLFEHFNSQLAISFCDTNQNHRISNTGNNVERIQTSPFVIIQSENLDNTASSILWRDGHFACSNGDNPISFRNNENPNYSQEMTILLQKLGFKNSTAS